LHCGCRSSDGVAFGREVSSLAKASSLGGELTHPELPFLGVLDRVHHTPNGVDIVDFKTGKPREKHRRQLMRYRTPLVANDGRPAGEISAQYLEGIETWTVTKGALMDIEADLAKKIPLLTDTLRSRHPKRSPALTVTGAQYGRL